MADIIIKGAKEGNLKNLSLTIPRGKLVVFTGLSGSGKTTLAREVLYQECQRQYLEAIGYQGIHKPDVEYIRNVSPAVIITQDQTNKNPRSTVGTLTNIYTELRMIYEKLGIYPCPVCGEVIAAADCKEELEKKDGEFTVYMYCSSCGQRIHKMTRSHFSHNTREGACEACHGLGKVLTLQTEKVIDETLSLEEGAVAFWDAGYKDYQINSLYNAFGHYGIPIEPGVPVKQFSRPQKALLYYGFECDEIKASFPQVSPPKTVVGGKVEGIFNTLWRRISERSGEAKYLEQYFTYGECSRCKGEKLNDKSRQVTVAGIRLPELAVLSLEELDDWLKKISQELDARSKDMVKAYITDLQTKIGRILKVGLGYLSLDRQTITLSGGEMQRLKLAATLDSDLTGVIYILDEPTIGLHPLDTEGMITILKKLRDLGNTVIVIEHDTEVMEAADYIVDIGPGAGKHGGEIIGTGTLADLKNQESSVTGQYLKAPSQIREDIRRGTGAKLSVRNASLYNLQNISVDFPIGCLTVVSGVSGSGKSTLVFEVLGQQSDYIGMEQFERIITIEQRAITRMKRSNVATYSELYSEIRKIFAALPETKKKGLNARQFSFNTPGGRCENCEGLGYVSSNMLFFEDIEVVCPVCGGNQFKEEILEVKYKNYNIKDILKLSVEEAIVVFKEYPKMEKILGLLAQVGLSYLELGQTVTTLSGGEGQRLKLAKELLGNRNKNNLYLLDEPTTGLHPLDVVNFLMLLDRLVDAGNTVIVVEHNQQVIKAADWVIDLGPGGGKKGGRLVFEGTPKELLSDDKTATGICLKESLKRK